jgi:hypothetical protein
VLEIKSSRPAVAAVGGTSRIGSPFIQTTVGGILQPIQLMADVVVDESRDPAPAGLSTGGASRRSSVWTLAGKNRVSAFGEEAFRSWKGGGRRILEPDTQP